jgi:hypothetical protein
MVDKDDESQFDAFVKKQQAESAAVDWARERDDWLQRLDQLYKLIEALLREYTDAGQIKLNYRDVALDEAGIGSYTARQMIIAIGIQEITLTPIGTLLIGTKGRVDVVGPVGHTRFMLVDKNASRPTVRITVGVQDRPASSAAEPPKQREWTWKIVTAPPRIEYIELKRESLFRALLEVANG